MIVFFGGTFLSAFSLKNNIPMGIRASFLLKQNEQYFDCNISCGTVLNIKKHEISLFIPIKYKFYEESL